MYTKDQNINKEKKISLKKLLNLPKKNIMIKVVSFDIGGTLIKNNLENDNKNYAIFFAMLIMQHMENLKK